MLVDGGAVVNLMPYTLLGKFGKCDEDLTQIDMMLEDMLACFDKNKVCL
jgi:hypothetical protein